MRLRSVPYAPHGYAVFPWLRPFSATAAPVSWSVASAPQCAVTPARRPPGIAPLLHIAFGASRPSRVTLEACDTHAPGGCTALLWVAAIKSKEPYPR